MVATRSRGKRKAAEESINGGVKHERNGLDAIAKTEGSARPKVKSSEPDKENYIVVPMTISSSSLETSEQSKTLLQKSTAKNDDGKHQISMKTENGSDIKCTPSKAGKQQDKKDEEETVVPEKTTSTSAASINNSSTNNNALCDSSSDDDNEKKPSPKRKPTNAPPGRAQPSKKKPTFDSSSSSSDDKFKPSTIKSCNERKKNIAELSDEDSDSDVDEEELERTMKRFLSNNKLLDSSDDDSSDSSIENVPVRRRPTPSPRKKNKKAAAASSAAQTKAMKHMDITTVEPLPLLSDIEKEEALKNIDDEADKNLQRLLWSLGIRYVLLSYQFRGVRALTGVNDTYPTIVPRKNYTSKDWKRVLRDTQTADQCSINNNNSKKPHRGVLMADVMGLGKTVQAVVACMLRNSIAKAQGLPNKPTILVSPNHAVTTQWAETLIKAGVPSSDVREFVTKKGSGLAQLWHKNSDVYLLLNRYQLQTETRHLLNEMPDEITRRNSRRVNEYKSPLYPTAQRELICILKNQYLSGQGKEKNEYREDGETPAACVTRLLSRCMRNDKAFRTLVIDEAHFLKNLLAYWGLGASLLGLQVERVIPMSGTPYNNSAQDIATLMTFVDPTLHTAYESWWKSATAKSAPVAVADAVKEWNESYMIRREKKVLGEKLKRKHVVSKDVLPIPLELHVYENYESKFLSMLKKFVDITDDYSPIAMARKKDLYKHMISLAALARMSLIHPVIPAGGRDFTINFSPTRSHLSRNLCNRARCVCCKYRPDENLKKGKRKGSSARRDDNLENLGDDELMGDDESYMDDGYNLDFDRGEIIEVPVEYCALPCIEEGGLRHYVHEDCLDMMGGVCPLCADLQSRASMASAKESLMNKMKDAVPLNDVKPDALGSIADLQCLNMNSRPLYCGDAVEGLEGFRGSAKIESILSDLKKIPYDEKVLLLSFFKSSLDLFEGILHYELGVNCARFDGDLIAEERQKELDRFKSEADCKVLLMTVQTGGTGLNIVEANRVIFIDRWFNPFVHEQAEDRCYRLGQKRDVHVKYYDVAYTIDNCMRVLNEVKVTNASIVLADGETTLGMASSGLSYKEMNGLLGNSVRAARSARMENVLDRSLSGMDSAMVPPPNFADRLLAGEKLIDKHGYMLQRPRSPFATIADALLHMLGYTVTPNQTRAAAASTMQPKSEISPTDSENSYPEMSSSLSEEEEEEDRKQPAVMKPATKEESDSSNDIGRKVSVESTKSSSLLDLLLSDDDSLSSIPGPVFAKKSKP